jgi:hypothetical protein
MGSSNGQYKWENIDAVINFQIGAKESMVA